jgi:hypothetical protein
MLRRGITEAPPPVEEHPLFGPTNQAKLRAIEASDIWAGLRAGIEAQREALLTTPLEPGSKETLAERWGAIRQLSLLLHGGPQMILQHAQLVAREPEESPEGYVAKANLFAG